ncbi:hypothetical protein [Hyphomicrobium sp. 2TAF46]|uniref:hypothetical protein n=1 Tax=Hyphomicrobium sp. 2TAF46 TaxID=3233019 RepID=UPI003F8ECDA0
MTGTTPRFSEIMAAAVESGAEAVPRTLLAELGGVRSPVEAIGNPDQRDALFAAFTREYDFIQYALCGGELSTQDREKWIALSRWLIRELRDWTPAADPEFCRLVAACVVIECCGGAQTLWSSMPACVGANAQLLAEFEVTVRSADIGVTASEHSLLWECDVLAAIAEADMARDWVRIRELLPQLANVLFPPTRLTVAANALARFDLDRLVRSFSAITTTPAAIVSGRALGQQFRLRAASESANPHVQFCFTLLTLIDSPRDAVLPDADRKSLANLLVSVAGDTRRWTTWMRALNMYPVWLPILQPALGLALAEAPASALAPYVDSIELTNGAAHRREQVAECLRNFRAAADNAHARNLFALAHTRWQNWNFGGDASDALITGIARSELDYAVVGYVLECMSESQCAQEMHSLLAELGSLDNAWHVSKIAVLSEWNRILSRFQPYAHADLVRKSGGDWLARQQLYKPNAFASRYAVMRFSSR